MKLSPLHASLMTLALFAAGQAHAAQTSPEPVQLAQAETGATADFDAVTKFLAGTQDVSRLDEDKLQQRLKRARKLQETEGLPPDLDQALQQRIAELEAEVARRSEAAQQAPAPEAQPQAEQPAPEPQPEPQQQAEQPAPQPEPQPQAEQPAQQEEAQAQAEQPPAAPEQPAAQEQSGGADTGSAEIAQFLASVRPAAALSEDELRQQMQRATELAKTADISPDQRKALRDVIREARTELRNMAGEPAQPQQQPEAAPQPEPEVAQPQPEQPATEQAAQQPAPAEQPQAKPETPAEKQIAQPPQVDPALEQQARAILDDKTDVSTLKRRELRQRLGTIRDLLATNQLSIETREALRAKLAAERQVLRRDVAVEEGAPAPGQTAQQPQQPQQGGSSSSTTANTTIINNNTNINTTNTDVRVVLKDRRPADELADDELVRRIDVYRDVVNDDRYDEAERLYWQRQMERDRRYLRARMIEERRQRAVELRSGDFAFNVRIEDDYEPGRDIPDDVFAAEVDDEEIADVLVAPPRREIKRQYSVEEIERSPEARNAVARIEIDTVHFGFGEGFLREEEIDKLDRIAQVLEKILAKHPEEVFLLEGHTDAVGSDAANLKLSRQRAQAVKEALTTYYVIPAENLKTVGLGERYLKIPTLAPEAENRRVSLARITPLVGRAD